MSGHTLEVDTGGEFGSTALDSKGEGAEPRLRRSVN